MSIRDQFRRGRPDNRILQLLAQDHLREIRFATKIDRHPQPEDRKFFQVALEEARQLVEILELLTAQLRQDEKHEKAPI